MTKTYFNNLINSFFNYLASLGMSAKTLKNYKSDISLFTGWVLLRLRSSGILAEEFEDALPYLDERIATEYKNFLSSNNVSPKTTNRRFSTLRHLSKYLVASQVLNFDFMEGLNNLELKSSRQLASEHPVIEEFKKFLARENVSPNTIKNYTNDIKQFLNWLNTNSSNN